MATEGKRRKPPFSVQVLQKWVGEHARAKGVAQLRLQRWISFMVVAAVLDSIRDENGDPVFLLKGGVAMELRLGLEARATKDYDAAYRERKEDMLDRLDEALSHPHGDFTITRKEPEQVKDGDATRVELKLAYRGRSWSTVRLELAPAEGFSGQEIDRVPAIPLDPFGLDGPDEIPCVSVRYQIAQKLHACTEVWEGLGVNPRVRDLIDLLLLRGLVGDKDLPAIREASDEIFELRGKHRWPPTVTIFDGWPEQYAALAAELDFPVTDVEEAAAAVQEMTDEIDRSG